MMKRVCLLVLLPLWALVQSSCRTPISDGMVFRYNESAGVTSLDPAYSKDQALNWVNSQIYEGLIRLDSNLVPVPAVAKSWELSADGMTYCFHLRTDVRFHKSGLFATPDSSRTVCAEDFVYSLGRLTDPAVASPGRWTMANVAPNGLQAVDDSTLTITLSQPFPPMLTLLAMPYCSVVAREVVEHYGKDYRKHPIGTGPFKLKRWKEGVKMVLRRNEDYYLVDDTGRSLPYLEAVCINFIADKQTAFLQFVKGELDFMNSLDASYKDELLTRTGQLKAKYQNNVVMRKKAFLNTEYLGFRCDDASSPLNDVRIRKAINYAFDRTKMMKYLRNNIGVPATAGMVPPGLPGFEELHEGYGYHYEPDSTRALLAAAGFPQGKNLPPLSLATTSSYLDLCRYLQQQLSLFGIEVKLDVTPPAALRQQMAQGQVSWFRGSWIADYPDAENYLSLFFSPNAAPNGPGYMRLSMPELDRLYRSSNTTTEVDARLSLLRQMDSLTMLQAPVVPLYYDEILHFTHPNVHNLPIDAMNNLDLRRVTVVR